jgi:ketosteroid isomerase-like protein
MKKTYLIFFSLIVISMLACAQAPKSAAAGELTGAEKDVAAAVDQLMKAMVERNKTVLNDLTVEDLVYGHSAGKVQTKTEYINEIMSEQPLIYLKINLLDQTIKMSGNTAVVRHIFTADTKKTDGSAGTLRIGNTLVFKMEDGKWKLLCRQAYKID